MLLYQSRRIPKLRCRVSAPDIFGAGHDEQESEVRTFIREIRRYAAIEELDEAVLNRLISKILDTLFAANPFYRPSTFYTRPSLPCVRTSLSGCLI